MTATLDADEINASTAQAYQNLVADDALARALPLKDLKKWLRNRSPVMKAAAALRDATARWRAEREAL